MGYRVTMRLMEPHAHAHHLQGRQAITGCSRSTIERLVNADVFPRPVRVTAGRLGFVREEVED